MVAAYEGVGHTYFQSTYNFLLDLKCPSTLSQCYYQFSFWPCGHFWAGNGDSSTIFTMK